VKVASTVRVKVEPGGRGVVAHLGLRLEVSPTGWGSLIRCRPDFLVARDAPRYTTAARCSSRSPHARRRRG